MWEKHMYKVQLWKIKAKCIFRAWNIKEKQKEEEKFYYFNQDDVSLLLDSNEAIHTCT